MDGYLLPLLYAISVALGAWALLTLIVSGKHADNRKIKQRLTEKTPQRSRGKKGAAGSSRSIRNDLRPEGIAGWLYSIPFIRTTDDLLQLAFPSMKLATFLGIAFGVGASVFLIMLAVTLQPIVALVSGTLACLGPYLYAVKKKNGRQKKMDDQLPDAMDFLGRALRAGHSLASGMQMMGNELPQPIAGEFKQAFDRHSLGVSMDTVLTEMTRRIDSSDFAFFITAVLIQRQTGGDLSEVLRNISDLIRQRIRLAQQVKAKTAEGRFTGYLLVAFPAVMFVISYMLNADYAGQLTNTPLGQQMLAFAFGAQIVGVFLIRKLTQVTV